MADEDTQELPSTPPQGMVEVFDLDGNKHHMLRLNAHDMVQHLGWHWAIPRGQKNAPAQVHVLVSKKEASKLTADNSQKVDLASLSHDDLIAFAAKHFDMKFTKDVPPEEILAAIIQEQTG